MSNILENFIAEIRDEQKRRDPIGYVMGMFFYNILNIKKVIESKLRSSCSNVYLFQGTCFYMARIEADDLELLNWLLNNRLAVESWVIRLRLRRRINQLDVSHFLREFFPSKNEVAGQDHLGECLLKIRLELISLRP